MAASSTPPTPLISSTDPAPSTASTPGAEPAARPERLLVVARQADGGADGEAVAARYCVARWPDWPHPAMLSLAAAATAIGGGDGRQLERLEGALNDLLGARMALACSSPPRLAAERTPARMAHPRFGGEGLGWLRAAAVTVRPLPAAGDAPATPRPDALLEAVERLSLEQALEALPTDVERRVFRAGVALLE